MRSCWWCTFPGTGSCLLCTWVYDNSGSSEVTNNHLFTVVQHEEIVVPAPDSVSVSLPFCLIVAGRLNDTAAEMFGETICRSACTAAGFQCSGLRSEMICGESWHSEPFCSGRICSWRSFSTWVELLDQCLEHGGFEVDNYNSNLSVLAGREGWRQVGGRRHNRRLLQHGSSYGGQLDIVGSCTLPQRDVKW